MHHTEILLYPEILPLTSPATGLVVLLHGLGSDGHDLIGLVPYLKHELPGCHFIAPHGVEAYDMAPYGRQWFSLHDRDPHLVRTLLAGNVQLLADIIKTKQDSLDLTNKDTILIGFSQGTMIGLYFTLLQTEPLSCMIGFSGLLVAPENCVNHSTPVCLIHGEADGVVAVEEMDTAARYLSQNGIIHDSIKIPNLAHSIDDTGLRFAVNFIKSLKG